MASGSPGLIRTFVQHPNAANLLMMLILIVGLFAAFQINRQVFPAFGLDAVSINFVWPGASAEDIDTNILEVVEPEIRFVDGVDEINGHATEGTGGFWIVFEPGTNMSRALADVENGVRRVEGQLPQDMERPLVSQFELMEPVSKIALSGPFSEEALKAIAKEMRDELIALGIAKVNFIGARDPEVRVNVDPAALRRHDIKLADIAERVRDTSLDVPAGTVDGGFERQIRSFGLRKSAEAIGDIEVRSRGTGEKTFLKDIATIEDGFDESQPEGFFKSQQAITLQVMRSRDADAIEVFEIVDQYLKQKRSELPASLSIFNYEIRAALVDDRVNLMVKNGVGGLILVLIILYIFLNGRVALWVAAGIPVAMLMTFTFMWGIGESFNMVSLMALIMTLGIIVDDAIVVGEHAATRKEMGLPAAEAAESGATRMFFPVLASSLTTIAAFLPVLMVSNQMGQFMAILPKIVVFIILASLVECFLILPGHMHHAFKRSKQKTGGFRYRFNQKFNAFRDNQFRRFVQMCYSARWTTMAVVIAGFIVGMGLLNGGRVPFVFFPQAESEFLMANIKMNPGTPREDTRAALAELDRALFAAEDKLTDGEGGLIRSTFGTVGRSMSRDSWRELGADNVAGLSVELVTADDRNVRNPEMLEAWRAELQPISGVERLSIEEMVGGPTGGRPIDIRLTGADVPTLKQAALELREFLSTFPGVLETDDSLPYGKEEIRVELTPKGRALGFTTQSVSRQVRNASEGAIAKRFPRNNEETKLRIQFPEGSFDAQAFRELYLLSPDGVEVPLSEVVNISTGKGFAKIQRYNGRIEVAVTADINRTAVNLAELMEALPEAGLNNIAAKYNIQYEYGGEAEEAARSMGEIMQGAMIALAAIYIILAWVLGSYSRPIIVMAIIPFGLIGAIFGHLLLGQPLSMMSYIGLLGLMGILVNDSIILVTTIQERNKLGESLESAIIAGSQDRLRAVTLTSLTTIGGLTPLLFETSMQAQIMQPMAITMVFGIALATLIVLVVVPSLLGILDDIAKFFPTLPGRMRALFNLLRGKSSSPEGRA